MRQRGLAAWLFLAGFAAVIVGGCNAITGVSGLTLGAVDDAGAGPESGVDAPPDSADARWPEAGPDAGTNEAGADVTPEVSTDAPPDVAPPLGYRAVVLSDGPIAYWRLGEAPGATMGADEEGVFPLVYSGNLSLGATGAILGDPNTAVLLDGMSGIMSAGQGIDFTGTAPFTVEAWIAPTLIDNTNYRFVFVQDVTDANGRQEYGVFLEGGSIVFERYVNGAQEATGVAAPALGVFTYVAAVYTGTSLVLYLDGTVASSTPDARASPPKAADFLVGDSMGRLPFAGTIDEVAVYGKALSAARLNAHYLKGTGQ